MTVALPRLPAVMEGAVRVPKRRLPAQGTRSRMRLCGLRHLRQKRAARTGTEHLELVWRGCSCTGFGVPGVPGLESKIPPEGGILGMLCSVMECGGS